MMGALVPPENLVVGKQYIQENVRGGGHRYIIEFRELYYNEVGKLCVRHTPIAHFRDKNGVWTEEPQFMNVSRGAWFGIATEDARFYEIEEKMEEN
jgi:hypothetical protein